MTDVPLEPRRYSFSSNGIDQPTRSRSRRDSQAGARHFHGKKTEKMLDPGGKRESELASHGRKREKKRIQLDGTHLHQVSNRLVEDGEILVVKEVEELVDNEWEKEEAKEEKLDDEEEVEMELQVMQEEKEEELEVEKAGGPHNVRVPPEQILFHGNICASRCDPFPPVEV